MPGKGYDAPARRFLGEKAVGAGPFGLLALPVEPVDEDTVFEALERRLAEIDRHPHAQTPEADDARLALHAAAAQLMDPQVQRALLERWSEGGEEEVGELIDAELERQAMMLLSGGGAANASALRRLSLLALSHGISVERLVESILLPAGRTPERSAAFSPLDQSPEERDTVRTDDRDDPADEQSKPSEGVVPPPEWMDEAHRPGSLGQVILLLGVAAVGLGAIAVISVVVLADRLGAVLPQQAQTTQPAAPSPGPPPGPTTSPPTSPAPSGTPVNGRAERSETPPPVPDAVEIRTMLADAASMLELDSQAASTEFRRAVELASAHWLDHRADQRVAIRAEIVGFVHRAGSWPNASGRAIAAIAEHLEVLRAERAPGEVEMRRAVWASGMLARLRSDRDLPASARLAIDEALIGSGADAGFAPGAGFERGAMAGASRLGIKMSIAAPPQTRSDGDREIGAWEAWLACVKALEPSAGTQRDRVVLGALDAIIFAGGEGERARAGVHAVRLLAPEVRWGDGSEARLWLMRIAGSNRADATLVRTLMRTLSERSPDSMVGPAQIPSAQAMQVDRARIRESLARLWGLDQAERADELGYSLAGFSRNFIERSEGAMSPEDHLASAAALARLNLASALRFAGHYEEAGLVLTQTEPLVERARSGTRSYRLDGLFHYGHDEHRWALAYLQVGRRVDARVALLEELSRSSHYLGWIEADILVSEALRGDSPRVRIVAGQLAERVVGQPRVVNAFLNALPDAPLTRRNAELIETAASQMLPRADDPSFMLEARRAIVQRLLQMASEEREGVAMDRLSAIIAEAYAEISVIDDPEDAVSLGDTPNPMDGAELLHHYWLSMARRAPSSAIAGVPGGLTPGAIDARMNARLNLADGPVQAFLAYQIAICEGMALVVSAERPGVAPEVEAVLAAFEEERRAAGHVLEQVAACERAMARLWRIRLDLIGGG